MPALGQFAEKWVFHWKFERQVITWFYFPCTRKYSLSKQCWYLDQNFERRTTICFWQNYTNTFWNFVFFEVSWISFANLNKHFYILNSKFFLKKFHRNDFIWSLTKELICIENDWPIRSIQHFCWNLFTLQLICYVGKTYRKCWNCLIDSI